MPEKITDLIFRFNEWRKQKKNSKEKIPKYLWDLARESQEEFPHLKINNLLNIRISNWNKFVLHNTGPSKISTNAKFINIPASAFSIENNTISENCERKESLKICIGNNIQILIFGDV